MESQLNPAQLPAAQIPPAQIPAASEVIPQVRVTAAMVAAHAGVSAATVSLVTSGKTAGRVSQPNIDKVEKAVAELGYVVNGLGSSLAKGRSNIVILVAPDVANPFYAKVIAGVRAALGAQYQLLISVTDEGRTPEAADVRRLLALRPGGLLVDAPSARFLAELRVPDPMVLLDAAGVEGQAHCVNFDVAGGARLLAAHLAGRGHRTVAYLDSGTGTETFHLRRRSFTDEAVRLGMRVAETAVARIDVGAAAQAFAAAWEGWSREGVTGVVCATDTQAYGVLQEARIAGLKIPGDLAVTGFDDLPYSASFNPGLTSVHLPAMEMGRLAGEQLLKIMAGEQVPIQQTTLDTSLTIRGSTADEEWPSGQTLET